MTAEQFNTDDELTEKEIQHTIGDDIRLAFDDVEEFGRGNSPAVRGVLREIGAEADVVLACDGDVGSDDPFVYIRVFDAEGAEAAAVVMELLDEPDAVYVGGSSAVYPALTKLADNEYCWTVKDRSGIAEAYIE